MIFCFKLYVGLLPLLSEKKTMYVLTLFYIIILFSHTLDNNKAVCRTKGPNYDLVFLDLNFHDPLIGLISGFLLFQTSYFFISYFFKFLAFSYFLLFQISYYFLFPTFSDFLVFPISYFFWFLTFSHFLLFSDFLHFMILRILAMVHIWRKKCGIWNVCKFSLSIFGCTVASWDIKFKTISQNFLYLENKGSDIWSGITRMDIPI